MNRWKMEFHSDCQKYSKKGIGELGPFRIELYLKHISLYLY